MVSQKELADKWKAIAFILAIALFISWFIFVYFSNIVNKENQELKERLEGLKETFRIEYTCNYDFMNQTIISDYHDYEIYETQLKLIKEFKNQGYDCEVKT